jgi:microcystin degradation protein MlrC
MRIAIGGIQHESNTFSSAKTTFADFGVQRGAEILAEWGPSQHEMGGFIEGGSRFGFEIYPTLMAVAMPAGAVTNDALDRLTSELIDRIKSAPPLDAVLLALHGAMVNESFPDGDAEVVRRVRAALGPAFPLVVTHDFHGNIPQDVVDLSTALVIYKTCPHVDQRQCGVRAAEIASRIVQGEIKPTQAMVKPPMIYNIRYQNTKVEPMRPIVDELLRLEKNPKILAANVAGGYQYADVPAIGPSVVVVTDSDPELARREAQRLSDMLWATRYRLTLDLPDPAAAVRQAMAAEKFPVVLVEMGDNIGGGSSGDATFILSELIRQKAEGWVVAIADPAVVEAVARAGVGSMFDAMVGGKADRLHGDPVRVRGHVKSVNDGKFVETAIRHGGRRYHDQGLTAVIEVEGSTRDLPNYLLLTTNRQPPFSLHQLISCGVYPERQKILVVKAAIAFRAAYEPIAAEIIEVDTGGVTAVNPAHFTWRRARRPLFGLDKI